MIVSLRGLTPRRANAILRAVLQVPERVLLQDADPPEDRQFEYFSEGSIERMKSKDVVSKIATLVIGVCGYPPSVEDKVAICDYLGGNRASKPPIILSFPTGAGGSTKVIISREDGVVVVEGRYGVRKLNFPHKEECDYVNLMYGEFKDVDKVIQAFRRKK